MNDAYARQAVMADANRRNVVEAGAAAVNKVAGSAYDRLLVLVAAAFRLHLGKQFDAEQFIREVGRLRFRKLPMQDFPMTDAAGAFVNAQVTIAAPSDRHQLVLVPAFELSNVTAGVRGPLQLPDAQLVDAVARLEVTRPQSDAVPEAFSDYDIGSQQHEIDGNNLATEENRQSYATNMPWGVEAAIRWSFAALPKLNELVLGVNNMTGGPAAPSGVQISGALHVYVIDCILGGN